MKRLALFAFLIFAVGTLKSADIQSGETFADGQSVTAARLNNHVNGATIRPAFISDKSEAAAVTTDSFLFYQSGSGTLLRTTLTDLQTALFSTPTVSGTFTNAGATVFTGIISPSQITSDQNDYAPTSFATATTLRLSTDATRNITGLAGGASGRFIIVHNVGSFNIVLNHANTGSSAANRFTFANGFDDIILPDGVRILQYDGTTARWRALARNYNIAPAFVTLTDGATITWTLDATKVSQRAKVTLAGSRQLLFSGLAAGMTGELEVIQDGTGSRKLALPTTAVFTDGVCNGTTTFTSATATFVTGTEASKPVNESGNAHITAGTTVASVTNTTTAILSATCATGTGITFYLPARQSKVLGGGNGAVSLSTTASSIDFLTWVYDGTNIIWAKGTNAN